MQNKKEYQIYQEYINNQNLENKKNFSKILTQENQGEIRCFSRTKIDEYIKSQYCDLVYILTCQINLTLTVNEENIKKIPNIVINYKLSEKNKILNLYLLENNYEAKTNKYLRNSLIAINQAYNYQQIVYDAQTSVVNASLIEYSKKCEVNSISIELFNEQYNTTLYSRQTVNSEKLAKNTEIYIQKNLIKFCKISKKLCNINKTRFKVLQSYYEKKELRDFNFTWFTNKPSLQTKTLLTLSNSLGRLDDRNKNLKDYLNPNIIWYLTFTEIKKKLKIAKRYHHDIYFKYIILPFCYLLRKNHLGFFRRIYAQHLLHIKDKKLLKYLKNNDVFKEKN
jgi:hypothetical protein